VTAPAVPRRRKYIIGWALQAHRTLGFLNQPLQQCGFAGSLFHQSEHLFLTISHCIHLLNHGRDGSTRNLQFQLLHSQTLSHEAKWLASTRWFWKGFRVKVSPKVLSSSSLLQPDATGCCLPVTVGPTSGGPPSGLGCEMRIHLCATLLFGIYF